MKSQEKLNIRFLIISQYDCGQKASQIQEYLRGKDIIYSQSQINKIIKQYKDGDTLNLKYAGNQNAKKRDSEFSQNIFDFIQNNQNTSLRKIQTNEVLNPLQLCKSTIANELKEQGFQPYKLEKQLPKTNQSDEKRLDFLKSHQKWSYEWYNVHFTDESKFEIDSLGYDRAWVQNKEEIDYSKAKVNISFPRFQINVWAMINNSGPEALELIEGNLDSEKIIQIYDANIGDDFIESEQILQFDNASPHTSGKTINYLNERNIQYLSFPPYSPDLNIIENIFSVIKTELVEVKNTIENKEQLFKAVQTIFFNSNQIKKTIQNAYKSYFNRIQQKLQQLINNS